MRSIEPVGPFWNYSIGKQVELHIQKVWGFRATICLFSNESNGLIQKPVIFDHDSVGTMISVLGKRCFLSIDFPTEPSNPLCLYSRIRVSINRVPVLVGPVQIAEGGAAKDFAIFIDFEYVP